MKKALIFISTLIAVYLSQAGNLWALSVTSVSPGKGPLAGQTPVMIYGEGFTPASEVKFGGTAANSFTVLSDTAILAYSPQKASTGNVFVEVSVGVINSNPDGIFGYVANNAAIHFDDALQFSTENSSLGMVVADFDGDGKAEAAVSNEYTNQITIYRNGGANVVISAQGLLTPFSWGDLTRDGKPDLVTVETDAIWIFRNTSTPGNISFATGVGYITGIEGSSGYSPTAAVVADFDGDGWADIATCNQGDVSTGSSSVIMHKVTYSAPNFTIIPFDSMPVPIFPYGICTADFNKDGLNDLAVTSLYQDSVRVLQNLGGGAFSNMITIPTGVGPIKVFPGDFDKDGKDDLAVVNSFNNTMAVHRNISSLSMILFDSSCLMCSLLSTEIGPFGAALGEFNGDGKLDMAAVDGVNLKVFPNTTGTPGSISFGPRLTFDMLYGGTELGIGDWNNDGYADIFALGSNINKLFVFVNEPTCNIWTGGSNSLWTNQANWMGGVPGPDSCVVIRQGGIQPILNFNPLSEGFEFSYFEIEEGATLTLNAGAGLNVHHIIISGTFTVQDFLPASTPLIPINVSGDWFLDGGDFNEGHSKVYMEGPGVNVIFGATNFHNLIIDKDEIEEGFASSVLCFDPLMVENNFIIAQGEFHLLDVDLDIQGVLAGPSFAYVSGHIQILENGEFYAYNSTIGVAGNWTNYGKFFAGSSIVIFQGSQDQVIEGQTEFNEIQINKTSSTGTVRLAGGASVTVYGQVNISVGIFDWIGIHVDTFGGFSISGSGSLKYSTANFHNVPPSGNVQQVILPIVSEVLFQPHPRHPAGSYANTSVSLGCPTSDGTLPGAPWGGGLMAAMDLQKSMGQIAPIPVYLHNGQVHFQKTDLSIPGRNIDWEFSRSYNSRRSHVSGPIGYGWDFNYNIYLDIQDSGNTLILHDGNHRVDKFVWNSTQLQYIPVSFGIYTIITRNGNGNSSTTYKAQNRHGVETLFDYTGRLQSISDTNGNELRFFHEDPCFPRNLTKVLDTLNVVNKKGGFKNPPIFLEDKIAEEGAKPELAAGFEFMGGSGDSRAIYYYYEDARFPSMITRVQDFSGREIKLAYNNNADLVSVTSPLVTGTPNANNFPNGKTEKYTYSSGSNNPELNHNLLKILRPNEIAINPNTTNAAVTFSYYSTAPDSAFPNLGIDYVSSQSVGGINHTGISAGGAIFYDYSFLNSSDWANPNPLYQTAHILAEVSDRNGNSDCFFINHRGQIIKEDLFGDTVNFITMFDYNSEGELKKTTYPRGNFVEYFYDEANTDRQSRANLLSVIRNPGGLPAPAGQATLSTSYTWSGTAAHNRMLTSTDEMGFVTTFQYDSFGNLQKVIDPVVTAGGASSGFTQYWYNDKGQVIAKRDPDKSQSFYTYYEQDSTPGTDDDGNSNTDLLDEAPQTVGGAYLSRSINRVDIPTTDYTSTSAPPAIPSLNIVVNNLVYDVRGNLVRHYDGRGIRTDYTVNQLNQVVLETRAANISFMATRDGGFNNTDEGPVNPGNPTFDESETFVTFQYKTEHYYDFNDNLIASFIENRQTGGIHASRFSDGAVGISSVSGILPFAALNIYPAGKAAYIENYFIYDILDDKLQNTQEAGNTGSSTDKVILSNYRYDANQNPVQLIYPLGQIDSSVHDERDLLKTATRGFGSSDASTTTRAYDLNGNLLAFGDAVYNGGATSSLVPNDATLHEYDGYDRLTRAIDAMGNETIHAYDKHSNLITLDRLGPVGADLDPSSSSNIVLERTRAQYDEMQRLFQTDREILAAPFYGGLALSVPWPGGADHFVSRRNVMDANSRVIQVLEDDGGHTEILYDGLDRKIKVTDAEDNVSVFGYDDNNNIVLTAEFDQGQDSILLPEVQALQKFFSNVHYDTLNRPVMTIDNIGQALRSRYDSRDLQTFASDAKAAVNSTGVLLNPISVQRFTWDFVNDIPGSASISINRHGNISRIFHDGIGRPLKSESVLTIDGSGDDSENPNPDFLQGGGDGLVTLSSVWDKNSRLESQMDDRNKSTTYMYDDLNRRFKTVNADAKFMTLVYDRDDNVVFHTDFNGSQITCSHDGLNRRGLCTVNRAGQAGEAVATVPNLIVKGSRGRHMEYDGLSRPILLQEDQSGDLTFTDPVDREIEYQYDSLSKPVADRQGYVGELREIGYGWKADANLSTLIYPNAAHTLYFFYDSSDRLRFINKNLTSSTLAHYSYLGKSRLLRKNLSQSSTVNSSSYYYKANAFFGYDDLRRPSEVRNGRTFGGSDLYSVFNYHYDRGNNRIDERRQQYNSDGTGLATILHDRSLYDSLSRLRRFDGGLHAGDGIPGFSSPFIRDNDERYWLDGAGNWEDKITREASGAGTLGYIAAERHFTINDMNEYSQEAKQVFDSNGDPLPAQNIAITHDPNGNRWLRNPGERLRYDYLNRLVEITEVGSGQLKALYYYDAQNRRVRRELRDPEDFGAFVKAIEYLYSGASCIVEYEDANATPGGAVLQRNYFYGSGPDEALMMEDAGGFTGLYTQNGTASVSEILDEGQSGTAEGVLQTRHYQPFGQGSVEPIAGQSQPNEQPFGWKGKREEADAGLHYFNARYMDSNYGRFVSRDPHGIWGDPINIGNPYTYCGNNPVNMSDPDGELVSAIIDVGITIWDTAQYALGNISGTEYAGRMALNTAALTADVATGGFGGGMAIRAASWAGRAGRTGQAVLRGAQIIDRAQMAYVGIQAGISTYGAIQHGEYGRAGLSALQMYFSYKGTKGSGKSGKIASEEDDVVKLYHQGKLEGGKVSGKRALSMSKNPDLKHYNPEGELFEFHVPRKKYNEWFENMQIQEYKDLHKPTGKITSEVRIWPPVTAELNNYIIKPGG